MFIFSQDHDRVLALLLFVIVLLFFFCLGFAQRGLLFETDSIMRASSQVRSCSFVLWHQRKLTRRARSLIASTVILLCCFCFHFQKAIQEGPFLCGDDPEELQSIPAEEAISAPAKGSHRFPEAGSRSDGPAGVQTAAGGEAGGGSKEETGGRGEEEAGARGKVCCLWVTQKDTC